MAPYKHFFIQGNVSSEKYKSPSAMGAKPRIPVRDRATHSERLLNQFAEIWNQRRQLQQLRNAEQIATREGTYIQFTSNAGHDLITKSLEDLRKGIRLLNIKEIHNGENRTEVRATFTFPKERKVFLSVKSILTDQRIIQLLFFKIS
jgi:hypothetical protein